jgi:hypothetical protein
MSGTNSQTQRSTDATVEQNPGRREAPASLPSGRVHRLSKSTSARRVNGPFGGSTPEKAESRPLDLTALSDAPEREPGEGAGQLVTTCIV